MIKHLWYKLSDTLAYLLVVIHQAYCKHDYYNEGHIGPESGRETIVCRKCDHTLIDHIYY